MALAPSGLQGLLCLVPVSGEQHGVAKQQLILLPVKRLDVLLFRGNIGHLSIHLQKQLRFYPFYLVRYFGPPFSYKIFLIS